MSQVKQITFGDISLQMPEVWDVITESYTEPDGRECAMIDISAEEGDPRSIVIRYGPMPDGSDALMEAGGTYEEKSGKSDQDWKTTQYVNMSSWGQQHWDSSCLPRMALRGISYVLRSVLSSIWTQRMNAICLLCLLPRKLMKTLTIFLTL